MPFVLVSDLLNDGGCAARYPWQIVRKIDVMSKSNRHDMYNNGKVNAFYYDMYAFSVTMAMVFADSFSYDLYEGLRTRGNVPAERECVLHRRVCVISVLAVQALSQRSTTSSAVNILKIY